MTTIAVVGVGQMGQSALNILLEQLPQARFIALDRSADAVNRAAALAPDRVSPRVSDVNAADFSLAGVDLVINLSGPFFSGSDAVAQAALSAGANYVDIGDDLEATETIIALHQEALTAGVSLVTGAGLSPGVSNWFAARLLAEHAEADGIQVVWVTHETDPGGLAPLRHMLHMAVSPCPVWSDGAWTQTPGFSPSTSRTYRFPAPLGDVEAYSTAHPEPLLLSRHFPQLSYAGCRGALQPAWANAAFSSLGRIGFGYTDIKIPVGDHEVEPAEFLWKLLWARHDARADKKPASHAATAVLVQALRGSEILGALALTDDAVMSRATGLGAAVAALVMLDEAPAAGAWGPEVLPWQVALPAFEKIGQGLGGFADGIQVLL
ncbi:saccharopine dehydrogenase family protein [Nocardia miyunensis]|uniref:saccharopine dehydrogenase family protein n=1 Tax=Nocardia miyunensis TaxID=282684 RepID=UPI000B2F847C|nr:saccharopine dehydrogenase NADP-binding domain-containing protein [Nocardia miyunensis]